MVKRRLRMISDKIRFLYYLLQYLAALIAAQFIGGRAEFRNLWIIAERGNDAGDNGYHLFKYIRKHHPELNIKYIISKESPDRGKVEKIGEIIFYRSFAHMLAFVLSEVKISTHIMGYSHDMYFFRELDRRFPVKGKKIFLQHGITKDNTPYLYAENNRLDLFVCSAAREYEFIRERFGYREGVVRLLGLCRYDALPSGENQEKSRVILLMPTWRTYMEKISESMFKKSRYYQAWQSLLQSRKLHEMLEKYGYRVKFFPHKEIWPYLECFEVKDDLVSLAKDDEDIQQNLIKADVLITDFSSVFFDFAYMRKPCVYYQFDRAEFRSRHYQEGYFSYEADGFGPVTGDEQEMLYELEKCLLNNCEVTVEYKNRIQKFFLEADRDNCRRNYCAIRQLLDEEGNNGTNQQKYYRNV